jgi:PAS domain S-box-containing protein
VAPEAAPDGSTNLVIIARDITDSRRTSEALGESASRTRSLLRAIPDMVFRIGRDGTYLDYFPGIGIAPVVPPGEFLGRKVTDVLTDDFAPGIARRVMELVAAALDSGDVHTMEYAFMLPDGDVDYEARAARCGDDDVILVVRDISDRKTAERRAEQRGAWWRTLAENVPALITAADTEGRIQYLNNPVPPMTRESVIGTSVYDYVDEEHRGHIREIVARVISSRETEMFEIEAEPGPRWYQSHIAPIISSDEVTGVIIVSIDITERRNLEHELAVARDEIEDKVEAAFREPNEYGLSFRELTVLALVAEGQSDKEIASVLGLRPRTVSKHVEKILRKMRCGSRTEAGVRAIREKLVP